MHYKIKFAILSSIIFVFFLTCKTSQKEFKIWENIRNEVKEKDISYLLDISLDTLDCIECNNGKSKISKSLFFKEHFDQMNIALKNNYGVYTEEVKNGSILIKRYRISYQTSDNSTIVYTILKYPNGKIKFSGVFGIP